MGFGRSSGGGRRTDQRQSARSIALISTLTTEHAATLLDVSGTGVRLRGEDLPPEGEELILTLGSVCTFGRVAWKHDGECGIVLGSELPSGEIEAIRRKATELGCYPPELRIAFDGWTGEVLDALRLNPHAIVRN